MKTFIFVCFLSIAAAQDAKESRIPNCLLKCMLLAGLIYNAFSCGAILDLMKVCGCSFLIGLLFYRMRVLGAGDVKLMVICGLFVPFSSMCVMWYVALLITAVGGGLMMYANGQFTRRIFAACCYIYSMIKHKKITPYAFGVGIGEGNVFPFGYSVLISVLWLLLMKGEL